MPRLPSEPEPVAPSVTRRVLVGGAAGASAGLVAILAGFSSVFGTRTAVDAAIPGPATTTDGALPPPAQLSPPPGPAGRLIAKVGDVPVAGGTVFPNEAVVLTQPAQGQFKAFSAKCTHMGCTVAGVDSSDIVCGCHGSRFSIQDGSVRRGPAQAPLARRTVNVDGGNLYLV